MKGKLVVFVGILCITSLIASVASAKVKPVKPVKPDDTNAELIVFTEDLEGWQLVEDCCPNAGPFPEYTMTLNFAVGDFPAGYQFDGQLFINAYGVGHDQKYIVQFWNDHDGPDHIAIEIIGGEIYQDKKTKILTVVFTDEKCVDQHTEETIAEVSFTLVRSPN